MFSVDFFKLNRKRICDTVDVDLIVLSANGLVQKSADTTFPLRQDSNFWYLTGLDIAEAVVVIDKLNAQEYLVLPPRLKHRDLWEGELNISEITQLSGIGTVLSNTEGWERLKNTLKNDKVSLGTILPARSYEPNYGMYINPAKLVFGRKIKRLADENIVDIRRNLALLRQVKTTDEISAIKKAVDITSASLAELQKSLSDMRSEKEVGIFLSHEFAQRGANGHAYDPIIACGKNATTIHYEKNDSILKKGSLLLLDVGAQYQKYAADISRTWAIGPASDRQVKVHMAVERVHSYAMSLLKPGVVLREYEKIVRSRMKKELLGLGLVTNKDDHLKYYPHLTSHFLGIDVHDAGDYDLPLAPNTVLTVEPGIYIPQENIGVRIEDDVLITDTGCHNLSASIQSHLVYYK